MGERVWNDRYNKKENETDFEHGLRLCEIKCGDNPQDLDWQDIVDICGLDIHKDSLRKAFNTTEYGGYNVLKYFNNKLKKVGSNKIVDSKIKELEEANREYEIKKIQFQDQKREYRNYLRADARFKHLRDSLTKEIEKLNDYRPLDSNPNMRIDSNKEAVLILSDWHMGLEVENHWNKFNNKIAKSRLENLRNKVVRYCKLNNVKTLRVEILGDMINGYIHVSTRISNEEDVSNQIMHCSEMLSDFFDSLIKLEAVENIFVYNSTGNHGRCMPNYKESLEVENFERLIPWYLKTRLANNKNITIVDNKIDDNIIVYEFLNEKIFAVHGHVDKMGKIVDDLSKMLKMFPTEIHMGHFHRHSTIEDNDIELVVNGSFSGTDEYAKSIRKSNKPSQTLIIYGEEGQECIYKIKL